MGTVSVDLPDTSAIAAAPPAGHAAPSLTWAQLQARIVQLNTAAHQIAAVWHPDASAEGELVETNVGNVRGLQGDARYQLTTGEVVEL